MEGADGMKGFEGRRERGESSEEKWWWIEPGELSDWCVRDHFVLELGAGEYISTFCRPTCVYGWLPSSVGQLRLGDMGWVCVGARSLYRCMVDDG